MKIMPQYKSKYYFLEVIVKISLAIFLVSTLILALSFLFVITGYDGSYEDFVRSQLITQNNIQFVMLMASLLVIMVTTLITWVIGLYASFKVAGPLYRFSENISHINDNKEMLNIREGDCFQDLSVSMLDGFDKIDAHNQELKLIVYRCSELMTGTDGDKNNDALSKSLHDLKDVESRIKLGD